MEQGSDATPNAMSSLRPLADRPVGAPLFTLSEATGTATSYLAVNSYEGWLHGGGVAMEMLIPMW